MISNCLDCIRYIEMHTEDYWVLIPSARALFFKHKPRDWLQGPDEGGGGQVVWLCVQSIRQVSHGTIHSQRVICKCVN